MKGRSTPEWSRRFDHGFSQLVDWFYTLDDYKKTGKFVREFGEGHVTFSGLLVIGRNSGVTDSDRVRLSWRTDKVLVDSRAVNCITFDGLYGALVERMQYFPAAAESGK